MSSSLIALASGLIGLLALVARLFFWWQGRKQVEAKIDEEDANVLERQRDNNVVSLDDADSKWVRIRKDQGE